MQDRLTGRTLVIATGHALSLALGEDGRLLAEHHERIGLGHAEALMPALTALLAPFGGRAAGVAHIIVETGPGSFTGLRIGHAAATALALAWGADLSGVRSTLLVAAQARQSGADGLLGVALAAPRGQLWCERFHLPALSSRGAPIALLAPAAADWLAGAPAAGSGAPGQMLAAEPRAACALGLSPALFDPPIPLYVRQQDASAVA